MDLFDEFKAHISHRLSNPFTPAFLVSWSVWNYKTLILLLSGMDAELKIAAIQAVYAWENWHQNALVQGVLIPAFFAGLYVWLSPRISRIIMVFWKIQESGTKGELVKIEDEVPLTRQEMGQIKAQMQKQLDERDEKLERRDITVSRMEAQLRERDNELRELAAEVAELKPKLVSAGQTAAIQQDQFLELEDQMKGVKSQMAIYAKENEDLQWKLKRVYKLLTPDEKNALASDPSFPSDDFILKRSVPMPDTVTLQELMAKNPYAVFQPNHENVLTPSKDPKS